MDEPVQPTRAWRPPFWAVWLSAVGLILAVISGAAIAMLSGSGSAAEQVQARPVTLPLLAATSTPIREAMIERQAAGAVISIPSPTFMPSPTAVPPPIIEWSDAEKNALSWLCYGEVGGMREKKIDACLSVISTIRARYAYGSGFAETDVISTLQHPGQFTGVKWETDRPGPDPDLLWAVSQYQAGARGSCTGYLYFDSIPGGPVLCVIRASNGQFMEFHNGWH